jgi:hypothetical protein
LIAGLAFSPDNTRLASAGYDHALKLWDPATGQELRSIQGQRRFMTVAFSPDGTRLVAGCQDNPVTRELTLRMWDSRSPSAKLDVEREAMAALDFYFAKPLRGPDVVAVLQGPATLSPEARARAITLAPHYPEETDPERYYQAAWHLVGRPGLHELQYHVALSQATAALQLRLSEIRYQVALAAAQYRTGHFQQARLILTRVPSLNAAGLALLAMAQERLGEHESSRLTFDRLKAYQSITDDDKDTEAAAIRSECYAMFARSRE